MASNASKRSSQRRPARSRSPYRAARAFYLTLFIGICFATFAILSTSFVSSDSHLEHNVLHKRDGVQRQLNDDEQCRLVHRAKDKCAFIKSQCPNEEPGFSAYLALYYCKLAHAKPAAFLILISWLGLLFSTIGIAASDFFCINLSTIATILGMSESMAGVTFLAFGNGSPDVFSTFAAMSTNSGSLAVGELFGAAGFITAVVSGSMALIRPFHVARKSFIRDVGFFSVAAAFSMVFLWDGKLHFWECITMVLFYIFYVAFVVVWHWWLGRRRRRREKEAAARGHFLPVGEELEIEEEEYHDDPDDAQAGARPGLSRGVSREDWSALERGGDGLFEDSNREQRDEDEEEEARDRWMSELNSNMRLTRPNRSRKNTLTPVRPSLVGALEFQAVLKSLQRSRNIQTYPMNTRRYSDDPTYTTAQQQDQMSRRSDPASRPPYQLAVHEDATPTMERSNVDVPSTATGRARAVSVNDAEGLRIDPSVHRWSSPERGREQESLIDFSESGESRDNQTPRHKHGNSLDVPKPGGRMLLPPSPTFEISPADDTHGDGDQIDPPSRRSTGSLSQFPTHLDIPSTITGGNIIQSPGLLAPNEGPTLAPRPTTEYHHIPTHLRHEPDGPHDSPWSVPDAHSLPKIIIPGRERSRSRASRASTPTSPFPRYRDEPTPPGSRPPSIYLPAPSIGSPESLPPSQAVEQEAPKRPGFLARWWPFAVLPHPGVLISTLFPTIYHWREKNYWEKALGVVAAPSVFLLTITLPVVEAGKEDEDEEKPTMANSLDSAPSKSSLPRIETTSYSDEPDPHRQGSLTTHDAADVVVGIEQRQHHNYGEGGSGSSHAPKNHQHAERISSMPITSEPEPFVLAPELWNRWLLIIQLFLAPIFIVLAIYSQSPTDIEPSWLITPILICLLVSLVLLIPLLLTTTPTHKPSVYRYILSLAGFVVSISWISTIASQVVGALKALAVILNMSHAIMGLTIFAVGNSLGDLVADVTVARLGYPVMALSACFGGPMLNILLGIGLSGSYILLTGANKRVRKHPDKDFKFKSYHIDVSNTLIVSGATLLVTLLGLLIFVPMNKWVLSKRIGWALILLWTVSTIGNVILEVTGVEERWGGSEDFVVGF